jgi:aspartate ammonia-lyase
LVLKLAETNITIQAIFRRREGRYEKSAAIVKEALKTGGKVYDLVLEKKWLTNSQLDDPLRPENMTDPQQIPK